MIALRSPRGPWLTAGLLAVTLASFTGCGKKDDAPKTDDKAASATKNDAKKGDTKKADAPKADPKAADAKGEAPKADDKAAAGGESIVVYSGRGASLVAPLFEQFTASTGIKVEVRYGKSTQALANTIATERANGVADVFFAQDSGHLGVLAQAGIFDALPQDLLDQVEPQFRDAGGKWVGTSGRARVLVYNPEKFKPEDLPTSLKDLPNAKYKGRLGWAPKNGSFQAHVSALRHLWGEEATEKWLADMKAQEAVHYPKNSPQVKAVSSGEIDIGWVNHYYLHKLKAADPSLKAANHSFAKGDAGNLMMVAGAGVLASSKKKEAALKLARFLVSEQAQKYFTEKVYEYPTRPGVALSPNVPPLSDKLVQVDQKHLIDLPKTLAVLNKLELMK